MEYARLAHTGIEAIDKEHTRLFELAQETHDLLNNEILLDKTSLEIY